MKISSLVLLILLLLGTACSKDDWPPIEQATQEGYHHCTPLDIQVLRATWNARAPWDKESWLERGRTVRQFIFGACDESRVHRAIIRSNCGQNPQCLSWVRRYQGEES